MSGERARRAASYENERTDVQRLVPPTARRVLDLGCSSGALGAALKRRQDAFVVGVELDDAYARDAAARLDHVITADLEQLDAAELTALGPFDCLLAADVLEHLRDPWTVLRHAVALLDHGGTAVVSLPNIRYWETFWQLGARGTWPRRSQGIFDETHLRFFTAADGMTLLRGAGLDVVRVDRRYRLRPEPSALDRHVHLIGSTPLRPFFVFQHLLVGRRP